MKALWIAGTNLRRTLRDRTAAFFLFVFPMIMVLVMGVVFGGGTEPKVAVVAVGDGPLSSRLVSALRAAEGLTVESAVDAGTAVAAVERGELEAAVLLDADYDARVQAGQAATVRYVARPGQQGQQIQTIVSAVVAREAGLLRAARFAATQSDLGLDEGLGRVEAMATRVPALTVSVQTAGDAIFPDTLGRFDYGASAQLLLFVFLTSMTTAAAVIESRRFGVSRRMLSTPTSVGTIVVGEGLGRLAVAATQALFIMLGSALIFGVNWGDPLGATALVAAFALVASGAGLLLGALARTPQQSLGVGLLAGLGLAALGGTMLPLELFSPTMQTIAHLTPHAWAAEGFAILVRRGGGLADVLPQVGVLLAIALALLMVAAWRLRRTLSA
ncbi:MAG TPA: ABC transporter permease [Jiangellales bacterium]|nr:ABC transporter permease [Jiangellales bacterium]